MKRQDTVMKSYPVHVYSGHDRMAMEQDAAANGHAIVVWHDAAPHPIHGIWAEAIETGAGPDTIEFLRANGVSERMGWDAIKLSVLSAPAAMGLSG